MRADAKLSSVHEAVVNRLKSKAPHLESKLTRNCGFALGIEFRESTLILNAKNESRVRAGMVFNVAVGLEGLEDTEPHAAAAARHNQRESTTHAGRDGREWWARRGRGGPLSRR